VQVLITERPPEEKKLHAADRDATFLRSQIAPHCTGVLRRRLALVFGDTTDPALEERDEVIERLLAHHATEGPRKVRKISGIPVSKRVCDALLVELKKWVARDTERRKKPGEVFRFRTNIKAAHYMIISSPKVFTTTSRQRAPFSRGCQQRPFLLQNTLHTTHPLEPRNHPTQGRRKAPCFVCQCALILESFL